MRTTILVVCLSLVSNMAWGATYYVDASAANDSGTGSSSSPKKYITSGIGLMAAGDTLILRDGTYTGADNMISEYAVGGPVLPPSGSAGNFTTIRADHVGQAIIDAQYNYPAVSNINTSARKRNYVRFDGIHFRHGSGGLFSWYGDHLWVSNCGFEDGMESTDGSETPIAGVAGGSSYGLIEDSWVWGKGRYGFYTQSPDYNGDHTGTNHMIFRRVVVRLDDTPVDSPWMTAALRFYGSNTNIMQNCIAIDGNYNVNSGEFHSFATGGGSSDGDTNDAFYGNIALNQPLTDCFWTEKGSGTFPIQNNVCWGLNQGTSISQDYVSSLTVAMQNNTIGQNSDLDIRQHGYPPTLTTTRDLFFTKSGASTFDGGTVSSPEYAYLASGGSIGSYSGATPTTVTSATQTTLTNAGLRYLPRTESGSTLATANVGATIMYQIGGTGTFYGDTGWNTTTSTQLWPFANEQMWAAKMAAYTTTGPGGNRGFAALASTSSTPLTDYIWSYLGNSMTAAGIYGDTPVTITPHALATVKMKCKWR